MSDEQPQFTADLMAAIGKAIEESLPDGFLFALLVFPNNHPGISNYVSNGNRHDMIAALREAADRIERNEDNPRHTHPGALNDEGT